MPWPIFMLEKSAFSRQRCDRLQQECFVDVSLITKSTINQSSTAREWAYGLLLCVLMTQGSCEKTVIRRCRPFPCNEYAIDCNQNASLTSIYDKTTINQHFMARERAYGLLLCVFMRRQGASLRFVMTKWLISCPIYHFLWRHSLNISSGT